MINEIDAKQWSQFSLNKPLSIFFNVDYLACISASFGVKIAYYNYIEKDQLLFLGAVFIKNNKITTPENFTYNPYWINPNISERKNIAIQTEFITYLKSNFKKIDLKFNVDIVDIRPFKWAGFDIDIRYTYIKDTSEASYNSISTNIKKATEQNITIHVNQPTEESISITTQLLINLKYSKELVNQYLNLLKNLSEQKLLICFEIYEGENLIGASICLLDHSLSKSYTLISNPVSKKYAFAHTLMYQYRIDWLKENNYKEVDFCGANYESIAYFKSYFNPTLKPYYVVRYEKKGSRFIAPFKTLAKSLFKAFFVK